MIKTDKTEKKNAHYARAWPPHRRHAFILAHSVDELTHLVGVGLQRRPPGIRPAVTISFSPDTWWCRITPRNPIRLDGPEASGVRSPLRQRQTARQQSEVQQHTCRVGAILDDGRG